MQGFRFLAAVAATSLALVLGLVVVGGLLPGGSVGPVRHPWSSSLGGRVGRWVITWGAATGQSLIRKWYRKRRPTRVSEAPAMGKMLKSARGVTAARGAACLSVTT